MTKLKRTCGIALVVIGIVGLNIVVSLAQPAGAPAAATIEQADPSAHLFKLGFKFQPAATCSNVKCHGAPVDAPAAGGEYVNPSFTLWNADTTDAAPADPHRNSFKTLRSPASQQMAKALGIANPVADASCIACHAIAPPENLRDQAFQVAEGITCNGCHGPSGVSLTDASYKGYNELHKEKGWVEKQRAAFAGKHDELLKKTGLYDTRPLVARSQQCVSCHLAISPKMVAAGHPQPTFEMNWYSLIYPNRHWTDPTDNYFGAKLWAAGQAAALEAALRQLADRAGTPTVAAKDVTAAYNQALAHYLIFAPLFKTGGVAGDMNAVAGQLAAVQKSLADPAKRADVAKSATAAADAAQKLNGAVDAWQPAKDPVMKVIAAQLAQPSMVNLGGFGIEQQRDAVFALYNAFASSADATPADGETRDFIGQTLFPVDEAGALISPFKVPPAQHTAAITAVKGKLKM